MCLPGQENVAAGFEEKLRGMWETGIIRNSQLVDETITWTLNYLLYLRLEAR